jgi:hypothetical protein
MLKKVLKQSLEVVAIRVLIIFIIYFLIQYELVLEIEVQYNIHYTAEVIVTHVLLGLSRILFFSFFFTCTAQPF